MNKLKFILLLIILFLLVGCNIDNPAKQNQADEFSINMHEPGTETKSNKYFDEQRHTDEIGDTKLTNLERNAIEYPDYIIVITDILNVRENSSVESIIKDQVSKDNIFEVLEAKYDDEKRIWYKIKTNSNMVGWIASWYCNSYNMIKLDSIEYKVISSDNIDKEIKQGNLLEIKIEDNIMAYKTIYDFNFDGIEEIIDFIIMDNSKVLTHFNGQFVEYKLDEDILNIGVIDINTDDSYIEIYLQTDYEVLPRTIYKFIRIIDNNIEVVGSLTSGIQNFNGDGKLYYWGGQLFESSEDGFNLDSVITYYDIEQDSKVTVNNPIGKMFKVEYNWLVIFKEFEFVYESVFERNNWIPEEHEGEYIAILSKGDEFKVLEIKDYRYKVELSNGEIGWIGGLHFYVD